MCFVKFIFHFQCNILQSIILITFCQSKFFCKLSCENAVAQAVEFLIEQLEDVPWEGTIMMAKPDKIIVNRGTREGVSTGMRFNVGDIEELVDEDTGEVLDSEMTVVAQLEVTNAKEKIAYCVATKGGPQIKKGMSVFPAE